LAQGLNLKLKLPKSQFVNGRLPIPLKWRRFFLHLP
jgi:hypothetical protein